MLVRPVYDVVLAHDPLVGALPVVVPVLLVVGAVGAVVWRDRHAPPDDLDEDLHDGLDEDPADPRPGPTRSGSPDGGASGSGRTPPRT